jgi:hypothetical protein
MVTARLFAHMSNPSGPSSGVRSLGGLIEACVQLVADSHDVSSRALPRASPMPGRGKNVGVLFAVAAVGLVLSCSSSSATRAVADGPAHEKRDHPRLPGALLVPARANAEQRELGSDGLVRVEPDTAVGERRSRWLGPRHTTPGCARATCTLRPGTRRSVRRAAATAGATRSTHATYAVAAFVAEHESAA